MLRLDLKFDFRLDILTVARRIVIAVLVLGGHVRQTERAGATRQVLGGESEVDLQRVRHRRRVHLLDGLGAGRLLRDRRPTVFLSAAQIILISVLVGLLEVLWRVAGISGVSRHAGTRMLMMLMRVRRILDITGIIGHCACRCKDVIGRRSASLIPTTGRAEEHAVSILSAASRLSA